MTNSLTVQTRPDQSYSVGVEGEVDVDRKNMFNVSGLNLDSLSMSGNFDVDNSESEQTENALGVKFGVKASFPGQSQLSGTVGSKVENNKLTDLKFTLQGAEAETGIELGNLPVINQLSMASRVRIERLVVGINPLPPVLHHSGPVSASTFQWALASLCQSMRRHYLARPSKH
jgi:hypothetical protein